MDPFSFAETPVVLQLVNNFSFLEKIGDLGVEKAMPKLLDTYQEWLRDGVLDDKLSTVQELTSKRVSQAEICKVLGVSERTLIKLKRTHPRLNQAFLFGNDDLKYKLVDAMYTKAIGFEYEEVQTTIEETKTGTKKKIVKNKKKVAPDYNSIVYLLTKKFGKEYHPRYEEIEMRLEKLENSQETWINENHHDQNNGSKSVSSKSKK